MTNRFCFHDEGPQYEFYKTLTSDNKALEDYFMKENLDKFNQYINHIEKGDQYNGDKRVWWKPNEYRKGELLLCFYDRGRDEGYTLCTDEEKQTILKGLKFGRDMFKKRLESYLKRYGTSKLHTWTYWADA